MGRIQLHIQVISVFIALLIHMAPSYAKPNDTYQIIVDAGSSGSRLYIYRILPQAPLYAKRQIKLLGNKKIKPGLASLAPAPQQVDQYVKPLLQYAQSRLKTRVKLRDVAINFMATAGMRQLSHTQQQAIYHHLKQYIKHQTPFKVGTVRTITGRWEGIYDWLAVNYLNQTLQQDKTVGVMDMGGASTEITYSPSTKDINQDAANINLKINHQRFTLISRSFLGLGQDQARHQFLNHSNCFYQGYPLPNDQKGTGDANHCIDATSHLINDVHHTNKQNFNIPPNKPFLGISGFYYITKSPGFAHHHQYQVSYLKHFAQKICHQQWNKLKHKYASKDPYLAEHCFVSAYLYSLLKHGYGFKEHKQIKVANKIKDQPINWPLGVAVYRKLIQHSH